MSKITFRADHELIEQLEEFDASKSEVMREALRAFLDGDDRSPSGGSGHGSFDTPDTLDALLAERVDDIIDDRLGGSFTPRQRHDVTVNITVDGGRVDDGATGERTTSADGDADVSDIGDPMHQTCTRSGESLEESAVYCPNCGEKSGHRVFCECGDELRSDWSFCPGCGRRTPPADVLDTS